MRKSIIRIACLVLPILVAACTHKPADILPQPSLDELATAQSVQSVTAVDVTQRCRQLTKPAELPRDYIGKNVYDSRAEWMAVARIERARLAKTDRCIADTHDAYAKGLPTK